MGFLNKRRAPNELPDLAIDDSSPIEPRVEEPPRPIAQTPEPRAETPVLEAPREEIHGEHYLEFEHTEGSKQDIKKQISDNVADKSIDPGFFDQILEDINGEIGDLGHLEEWYNKKFLPQDAVSNMRNYWEDNKAGILIQSFGDEYKKKINEKIKILRELEEDWRVTYFQLVKKESVMKKEERELKETLAEFVELCKTRKGKNEEKPKEKIAEEGKQDA
jgi:hypothetical protein